MMCCHPKDMDLPDDDDPQAETTEGITIIHDEDEIELPPPLIVEPTQEQLDELADRDAEIAEEDPL